MEEKELRTGTEEGKDSGLRKKDGQEYEKICYIAAGRRVRLAV